MTIASEFHRAWLLHRRPYKERSVIADCLVEGHGRVSMVVRGVRQARSKSSVLLQPFNPLLVRWKGRSELKTLVDIEPGGSSVFLTGKRLYCGFYVNELLMRAMIPGQPLEGVTSLYQETVARLARGESVESVLRSFELDLLSLSGYEPALAWDALEGNPLREGVTYRFLPEQGLIPVTGPVASRERSYCYRAEVLLALSRRDFHQPHYFSSFKRFTRQALEPLIGQKPMQSRLLFQKSDTRVSVS
ncbi:MAG: DNA repair protein RecO [Endozoicomonas sp.]